MLTHPAAESTLSVSVFSLFHNKSAERNEVAQLVAEETEKKRLREDRRQWAIENAIYICEGEGVDGVIRVAHRLYVEAFGEGWND